ncbi:MAG: hypothetical protein JWP46_3181 [Modestobacter sp.]|nr:hypothetical protein [Modestobacter sp.]
MTLLYFDGCPNWQEADTRVRQALREVGSPEDVLTLRRVQTPEQAELLSFRGSPTVLVNGEDPFAEPAAPVRLACRVYRTADGLTGAPSVDELTAVLQGSRWCPRQDSNLRHTV